MRVFAILVTVMLLLSSPMASGNENCKQLFVSRLDFGIYDQDLREAFENFGTVVSAKVIMDKYTD